MIPGGEVQSRIHGRVLCILADLFQIDIAPDAKDLHRDEVAEWDSVSHLHLVLELEESFAIALSDEEVVTLSSARDITSLLVRRGVSVATTAA
jgi:acyl carrier protein